MTTPGSFLDYMNNIHLLALMGIQATQITDFPILQITDFPILSRLPKSGLPF